MNGEPGRHECGGNAAPYVLTLAIIIATSSRDRALTGQLYAIAITVGVWLLAGHRGVIGVLIAALIAMISQKLVDCVQHYGLVRDEGTPIDLRYVVHGRLPHALAAAWIDARTCWKVPQRQMLVMALSMSASLGFGLSLSKAATAMIIPLWQ